MSAAEMPLALSQVSFPVRGLGYGDRVGIWLQGCSIRCEGCIVPNTWEAGAEHMVTLAALLNRLLPWLERCDGVTISGGEPFDQPQALLALVIALRSLQTGDILVYSGYPWRRLQREHMDVIERVDVVVSEPFVAGKRSARPVLYGSDNQRVHRLTELAQARYSTVTALARGIGVSSTDRSLELVGLLRPGELTALARSLEQRGFAVEVPHGEV